MAQLHSHQIHRRATLNRLHFLLYFSAIAALLYRHITGIPPKTPSALLLLLADLTLAFMWLLQQGFLWRPVLRQEFPSRLPQVTGRGLPGLDVFICTADPFKEPPASTASTVLSAMAFDYPADRLSVYVSDDGGSELTLFAFMEAAKFARYWLPFCRVKGVMETSPEAYFESNNGGGDAKEIKVMFEALKERVENVLKRGYVDLNLLDSHEDKELFIKWKSFTHEDHPSVIQVLCESIKDKDITGYPLPNLIYISREKRPTSPHNFKAGALNALVRVSKEMTNAPVILTLDCDMHSNDSNTPQRALCYLLDPDLAPKLSYVQFPQRYRGLNTNDIYGGEMRWVFLIGARGLDGLKGPDYTGTCCFFSRQSLFGPPPLTVSSSKYESKLGSLLRSDFVLQKAHEAASCKYEHAPEWGSKIGFRYDSLVEDFYTGYRLHCEGWRSVFCNPDRPAFLGQTPKSLHDSLSQTRRWIVGNYEVLFSRYCPLFYGCRKASLLTGFCYMYYSSWGSYSIPLILYGLLPQLALFHDKTLFPKVMFEALKERVENVLKSGYVDFNLLDSHKDKELFIKWKSFTREDHPPVIQVLCESNKDKDITGHPLPNLIYISREKRPTSPHHFKAGALNALVRVSKVMTNAPVLLTLDCDMHSNDPNTPQRALCYLLDPDLAPNLSYVQFPQRYRGLNTNDIYGGEIRWLFLIGARGFDGLQGPNYVGTCCFFSRQSLFGPPLTVESSKYESKVDNLLRSEFVIQKAHEAASCKYKHAPEWGSKIGFRYGSLVEDFYTGYKLQCEGWRSVFCHPDRPAFLGHAPKSLHDSLSQNRRWIMGLYEVLFSRYCPLFYGCRKASLLVGLCYMYYAAWGSYNIPFILYGLLPQLALFHDKPLLPKASDPWFFLYTYLFLASYGQNFIEYMEFGGSFQRWWNDQRMVLIRGITSSTFGTLDFILNKIGASAPGFNLTSKAAMEEESKLYDNGIFAFGAISPFFISMGTIAIVNLISFLFGLFKAVRRVGGADEMFLQLLLCGFVIANSLPVYQAMFIRKDGGKMPRSVTNASIFLACTFFYVGKIVI